MQINITARHLDLTPALAQYAQKKLERVARHFGAVIRAQVVLTVEKERHGAEVVVHALGHHDFRAKETAGDLYAALDLVAENLHKHMSRQKDKRVRGRRQRHPLPPETFYPVAALSVDEGHLPPDPAITRVRRFTPHPMTVAEAAQTLKHNGYDFLLFYNDSAVNVLYRRADDTFGLLEPNL
jgi:putative sigma-54 modulation protein